MGRVGWLICGGVVALVSLGIGCCLSCRDNLAPTTPPPDHIWLRETDLQPLEAEVAFDVVDGNHLPGAGFWIGKPSVEAGVGAYVQMPLTPPAGPPVWELGRRYVATKKIVKGPEPEWVRHWVRFDWDGEAIDAQALWRKHTNRPVPE